MAPKQGQPPPKPKPEELIAAFKEKFEGYRDETRKSVEDIGSSLEKIRQQDEEIIMSVQKQNEDHSKLIQEFVDGFSMKIDKKCSDLKVEVMAEFDKMAAKLSEETGSSEGCEGQINGVAEVVEDIQDKLIEFEERKRNNLIFYGVKGETRETPAELVNKVRHSVKTYKYYIALLDYFHYSLLTGSEERCYSFKCYSCILWSQSWQLQVDFKYIYYIQLEIHSYT